MVKQNMKVSVCLSINLKALYMITYDGGLGISKYPLWGENLLPQMIHLLQYSNYTKMHIYIYIIYIYILYTCMRSLNYKISHACMSVYITMISDSISRVIHYVS